MIQKHFTLRDDGGFTMKVAREAEDQISIKVAKAPNQHISLETARELAQCLLEAAGTPKPPPVQRAVQATTGPFEHPEGFTLNPQ